MVNSIMSQKIRLLTKEQSITLKTFMEDCGLNRNFMYDLEKGNTLKTMSTLVTVANYFDVSVDYLLGRTDNPNINR